MNDLFYYTAPNDSAFCHDLRPIQDDRVVLTNPHKGWYMHYVDNGLRFPFYRDTIRENDDLKFMPGLNHMYLRIDWSDIEEQEGVYDWSAVDAIIEKWGKLGYHFAIRLCTYEVNRPTIPYSTPEWVFQKGAKGTKIDYEVRNWFIDHGIGERGKTYTATEPDYSDEIYFQYLERFMAEYGRKFNGHPLIDFIDVGTFGTWGEGHTGYGSGKKHPPEVLKKHIDLHLKYFPDTFVLVNDDMIKLCAQHGDPDTSRRLNEYCAAHKMGFRDDSLYVLGYVRAQGYDMLAIPTAFDHYWKNAPIDLESGHQYNLEADGVMDGGYRMIEAMRRTHATYSGFHGDPYVWYEKYKNYHDYAANRLGYWYFPENYELPDLIEGTDGCMTLRISNRGFAPAYHRYNLRITAYNKEGTRFILSENEADNRTWMCDETTAVRLQLHTRDLPSGAYELRIGLFDGERPVRFGVKQELYNDFNELLIGTLAINPLGTF